MDKRPDLFEKLELTDKNDRKLLKEIRWERSRMELTEPVSFHPAAETDLPEMMALLEKFQKTAALRKKITERLGRVQ